MKIHIYNAGCGDAFRIEFNGNSGHSCNILIDAGFERTFRNILAKEFVAIESKKQHIDLCVITHIHDDHIGGINALVKSILAGRGNDIVLKWWFNPPRVNGRQPPLHRLGSVAQSIGQSDFLTSYLQSKNILPESPIISKVIPFDLDGMKIFVLSPDQRSLDRLTDKYSDPKIAIEHIEDEKVSQAVASKSRDYHIPLEKFPLIEWKQDKSIENASSIVLLTKYNGKTILWLADALPSIVIASLISLGYSIANPVVCDFVKIAHHGSSGNNSGVLYQMIKCKKYILSTDGYNTHGLPSKACLVEILTNPKRDIKDQYTFYLTTSDTVLKTIFKIDGQEVFKTLNFEMIFPINGEGFSIEF